MTIGELIVYNSTITVGGGTVLEHLQNIAVTREVVCGITVDVTDAIAFDVKDDIITADFDDSVITYTADDTSDLELNTEDTTMEINI